MEAKTKNRIVKHRKTTRVVLIFMLASAAVVSVVSISSFVMNIEIPYSIVIDEDEDFLKWCDIGNGTVENPYIIEGHKITVPEYYETTIGDHTTPCVPHGLISISGVSKSFIIEHNTLTMKNECGGNSMISIFNVEVPFIIRNNDFVSSGVRKRAIYISSVNGSNSKIMNNRMGRADLYMRESNNISVVTNEFLDQRASTNYIRECLNISFQHNFFIDANLEFYKCSDVVLHNNTFDFRNLGSIKVIFSYQTTYTRYTNNTFFHTGVFFPSDPIPLKIEGNTVNGKPLGFFYNQTNLFIGDATEFGQIVLIKCTNASITDQIINNTTIAVRIWECINTTIDHCDFTKNSFYIYVWNSNKTYIEDNTFFYDGSSTWGTGVYGRYSNGLYIRRNLFVKLYSSISLYYCTDIINESNTIQMT